MWQGCIFGLATLSIQIVWTPSPWLSPTLDICDTARLSSVNPDSLLVAMVTVQHTTWCWMFRRPGIPSVCQLVGGGWGVNNEIQYMRLIHWNSTHESTYSTTPTCLLVLPKALTVSSQGFHNFRFWEVQRRSTAQVAREYLILLWNNSEWGLLKD